MFLAVVLAFLFTFVQASDVIDLSDKNFNAVVLGSDLPVMVEFFAPWCGHCKQLAPEWEKAATNLKGMLPVGKVDCTVHQHLCSKYDVRGYPTIKCFSEKGKKVVDYQQARQASAIVRFATDQIPDKISRVKDEASLQKFLDTSSEQPHVVLFTTKGEISPLFKSLAVKYLNRILFSQVKKGVTPVEQKYNVQQFPTVISVKGDEVSTFNGAISADALNTWLAGLAGDEAPQVAKEEPKPKPKPKVDTTFTAVAADSLKETCSSRLCVVAFVDVVPGDTPSIDPAQNSILVNILHKWNKDGKFKFVWSDRNAAGEFGTTLGISGNGPTFVVLNGKRSKFAVAEKFSEEDAHKLLEHVNAGDVKYQQFN